MPADKTGAKYNVEPSSSDEEEGAHLQDHDRRRYCLNPSSHTAEDSSDPDFEEGEKPDEDEQYAAVKAAVEAAGVCKLSFIKTQFPKLADQAINRTIIAHRQLC